MPQSILYALKYCFRYQPEVTPAGYQVDSDYLAFWINFDERSKCMDLIAPTKTNGSPAGWESIRPSEKTSLNGRINRQLQHAIQNEESPISGWYLSPCDLARSQWDTFIGGMTRGLKTGLSEKKKRRWIFHKQGTDNSVPPYWAIRGYFIGTETEYAPPTVTVLCDDEQLSQWLVKSTMDQLHLHELPKWRVTRLPEVNVLEYGSQSDKSDSADQENIDNIQESWAVAEAEAERSLERIQVNLTDGHPFPTMANECLSSWTREQHRCGIRLDVIRDSNVVARGTIGGLIKVGGRLYGLTVAHALFSSNIAHHAQEVHDGNQDVHSTLPGPEDANSIDQESIDTMDRWQESGSMDIDLDWALVDIPGLQQLDSDPEIWEDVNLVHTVAGDFRPAMVAIEQPYLLAQVVLATPGSTHGLRGVFIGSEALIGIPSSSIVYRPWVLRMERPWLIQPGDSGSWAFDAHTGELLGVFFMGCPRLLEAYIIPAYAIFQSIQLNFQDFVGLVNCQPIGKNDWVSLTKTYERILDDIEGIKNPWEIESIEDSTPEDLRVYEANLQGPSTSLFKLRTARSSWLYRSPIPAVHNIERVSRQGRRGVMRSEFRTEYHPFDHFDPFGSSSEEDNFPVSEISTSQYEEMYQKALLQHPQKCYNLLSERLANANNKFEKATLGKFWERLVLGKIKVSLNRNISEEDGTNRRTLKNEAWLMTQETSPTSPDSLTPWDRRNLTKTFSEMTNQIKSRILDRKWKCNWSSLPETSRIELASGVDAILTTMIIWTDPDDKILAVFPPSSVGPQQRSPNDNDDFSCSLMRLPFKLGTKTQEAEEEMKSELIAQLELDVDDFKSLDKRQLNPEYSHFYLEEKGRLVELAVYEGFLKPGAHKKVKRSAEGWAIFGSSQWTLSLFTANPFRQIVD